MVHPDIRSVRPYGLSHSHSCSDTKNGGSGLIGWHLLQGFAAHASSTWRIVHQQGLPWYHHVKEYRAGVTWVRDLNIWQMCHQGACILMGGAEQWNFADNMASNVILVQKLCAVYHRWNRLRLRPTKIVSFYLCQEKTRNRACHFQTSWKAVLVRAQYPGR